MYLAKGVPDLDRLDEESVDLVVEAQAPASGLGFFSWGSNLLSLVRECKC